MNKDEKISYGRVLIKKISSLFLQEGQPYVVQDGYQNVSDLMVLYAKQTNLFESALLLLENNHAEEAYILVRSMLNNSMLIYYLCDDDNEKTRHKNFKIQPIKSSLKFLKNIKKASEKGWGKEPEDLDEKIHEFELLLINEGFVNKKGRVDDRLIQITELAQNDELLFGLYTMFYKEGSQYEHSDISTLSIYKQPIESDISTEYAFILDLSKTDENLAERVLNLSITFYGNTYCKLLKHLTNNYNHFLPEQSIVDLIRIMKIISDNNFEF